MKKYPLHLSFLMFLFFLTVYSFAQQKEGAVSLHGTLKNFSNQEEVQDMSSLQYMLPPSAERMIIPDSNGHFNLSFKLQQPGYFRLGRNILYLTPGDDLEVIIDKNSPTTGNFSGTGSQANAYLRNTPFPKGGSFLEAGRRLMNEPTATLEALKKVADARTQDLETLRGASAEFKRLEAARIKADLINSFESVQSYARFKFRNNNDSMLLYQQAFKNLADPLIKEYCQEFTDASLMKIEVYRDIVPAILENDQQHPDQQFLKDWQQTYQLVRQMKQVSDKKELNNFTSKVNGISTPLFKNAASQTLNSLLAFGKGDHAVDFTAIDMNGNKVSLSSLKGKVIYVDLWATWCGPCMEEMPHFEKLKEQYKNNKQVVLVSLSIDDNLTAWKNSVVKRNANGFQWQINRNKLDAYNIVTIPRSLLIDKNFNIVDMNAAMPSSKEVIKQINTLL